ncbi:hypothetical protein LuPra_05337 [Luteitalea pratensis]|jgi:hypothetical protein|uniref:Uncharacterized protein n=1 Tax=Luteitalea pratensis TaxID=1855912 RepID=A0A143PTT8_LUTPR|nr:hypothetical protein [Luteitalea pratensis]AMY12065.1 hypothetical protein LuPra_05337 [Luteitalea pratensis]
MAHINSDPYAGGHLFALANRVTCLLDSEAEVMAAVQALEAGGVATEDIDVFTGEKGAEALDLFGRSHGRAVRLLRTLEDTVADMGETNHRIDDALRKGSNLLCVRLHKRPLIRQDEDGSIHVALFGRDKEGKDRALGVLKGLHAHEIHYWGSWNVEDVPSV